MDTEKKPDTQKRLEEFRQALEAARKLQNDIVSEGLNAAYLYVEDVEGDWLEKWGEDEEESVSGAIASLNMEAIKEAIGITDFKRTELLEIALTHPSYTHDMRHLSEQSPTWQQVKYRRLALLGDAILGAVVTDYLYHRFPNLDKGELSPLKSSLVDRKKLCEFGQALNLGQLCLLGGSAKEIDKSEQNRFLSETFEALFGAIYLEFERDFSRTGEWLIKRFIAPAVNEKPNLTLQQQAMPEIEYRRRGLLGNDILGAIVIDYLCNHFPDPDRDKLTQWKSKLMDKKALFTKVFKAALGRVYLEFDSNFSRTRNWMVENYITDAVNNLLADEQRSGQFVDDSDPRYLENLVSHITEKDWREEFLRVASVEQPADKLLLLMKQEIDTLEAKNENLQQLLIWVNQKSSLVGLPYKPAEVRAFYLALVLVLDFALARVLDPNRPVNSSKISNFVRHFDRARSLVEKPDDPIAINLSLGDNPVGVIACVLAFNFELELRQALQELYAQLPEPKKDTKEFEKWRQDNGQVWLVKLRAIIGHNLQFSEEEKELLKQYYYAHNLLVKCLNSDSCEVTLAVREEIEETLLLPIDLVVDELAETISHC